MNTDIDPKLQEILLILQEECAEVSQAVSKCFRFGLKNIKYQSKLTNLEFLEQELGDLLAMIDLLKITGVITDEKLAQAQVNKHAKLKQWSNIYDH